jgi:hypothetical protein
MLNNNLNPLADLKQKAVRNQHYEVAYYIREAEREYEIVGTNGLIKRLNDTLKVLKYYNFYKPLLRIIKIKSIYDSIKR